MFRNKKKKDTAPKVKYTVPGIRSKITRHAKKHGNTTPWWGGIPQSHIYLFSSKRHANCKGRSKTAFAYRYHDHVCRKSNGLYMLLVSFNEVPKYKLFRESSPTNTHPRPRKPSAGCRSASLLIWNKASKPQNSYCCVSVFISLVWSLSFFILAASQPSGDVGRPEFWREGIFSGEQLCTAGQKAEEHEK